jgi:hypothetical protein
VKYLLLYLAVAAAFCTTTTAIQDAYYPILFIHGHGTGTSVEETWEWMVKNQLSNSGYTYQGKIWANSELADLPSSSIFLFGFYREEGSQSVGAQKGKIGGIPFTINDVSTIDELEIKFSWPTSLDTLPLLSIKKVDLRGQYFDPNRYSYASALKKAVDHVLEATGAKKIILVAHSMGGLVARSYIRWLGGDQYVYKLLTVGTPNHGIPDDGRSALEKIANSQDWQFAGEYVEMSADARPFQGKSFTEHLNEGWEEFCKRSGVQYATIAGNLNPWPAPIVIGKDSDGVIDSNSVKLPGAVFNGKSLAAHTVDIPLTSLPLERSIIHNAYTSEIIKRWIFMDELSLNPISDLKTSSTLVAPSPFGEWCSIQVVGNHSEKTNNPLCTITTISDALGIPVITKGSPLFFSTNHIPLDMHDYSAGPYFAKIEVYDMNGLIYEVPKFKYAKAPGGSSVGSIGANTSITLDIFPERISTSNTARFRVRPSVPDIRYVYYQLDNKPWVSMPIETPLEFSLLEKGLHRIKIRGLGKELVEIPIEYAWIIGNISRYFVEDLNLLGTKSYRASEKVIVRRTRFGPTSNVTVQSKAITITPEVFTENGARLTLEAIE